MVATVPQGAATDGDALVETPASAGTVAGVARVVLDPVGAALSTDPGWTPLFLTAGVGVLGPVAGRGATGRGQQPGSLVGPDRVCRHAHRVGQLADP